MGSCYLFGTIWPMVSYNKSTTYFTIYGCDALYELKVLYKQLI